MSDLGSKVRAAELLLSVLTEEQLSQFAEKLVLAQQAAIDGKCEQTVGVRFSEHGKPTHFHATANVRTVRSYNAE